MRHLFQHFVLSILANALALFAVQHFLGDRGFEISRGALGFLCVGIALGLLNTFVRPLLKLMSFPFVILSMGLFLIVVNAGILFLTEYIFNDVLQESLQIYFSVGNGFASYFIAAVLLSVCNSITHWLLTK